MNGLDALNHHLLGMPPVAAMQVRAVAFDGEVLQLQAPLAANVNDKGCAFGGSLVSLMTLAGWGLMTLKLREAGIRAEVYVADSQVRYLAPLYTDLEASARLADDVDWNLVLQAWQARGRARAGISATVAGPDGAVAALGAAGESATDADEADAADCATGAADAGTGAATDAAATAAGTLPGAAPDCSDSKASPCLTA